MNTFILAIIVSITVMSFGQVVMLDKKDIQTLAGLDAPTTLSDKAVASQVAIQTESQDEGSRAPASLK